MIRGIGVSVDVEAKLVGMVMAHEQVLMKLMMNDRLNEENAKFREQRPIYASKQASLGKSLDC
jgi:hypothetical protein